MANEATYDLITRISGMIKKLEQQPGVITPFGKEMTAILKESETELGRLADEVPDWNDLTDMKDRLLPLADFLDAFGFDNDAFIIRAIYTENYGTRSPYKVDQIIEVPFGDGDETLAGRVTSVTPDGTIEVKLLF